MSEVPSARARNLRTIGALAALFVLPLVLAFYTYYATPWRPAGRVNHGILITPPRPLAALAPPGFPAFRATWTLVYIGDQECDEDCRRALTVMRQTRLALNTDMTRVTRVFLATGGAPVPDEAGAPGGAGAAGPHPVNEPGLTVLDATAPAVAALLAQFPAAERRHLIFVVDPLGNLMMSYDARSNPRGLLEDLKKLLRLSHIG